MKKLILILLFPFVIASSAGCTMTHKFGPYYGKVIDAETREPIEGAAVLVVFYTEQAGPAGSVTHYADALETVTDKKGEFSFPEHRITAFKPLHAWNPHGYFWIFKTGYGCYPRHKAVKPMFVPNGTLPADEYVTVEIPNVKKESREKRLTNYGCEPVLIPKTKYKNLFRLINQERVDLGLEPRKGPK